MTVRRREARRSQQEPGGARRGQKLGGARSQEALKP